MASPPPSLDKLQKDVEGLMDQLQASHLIPLQKAAFLCSANCCDARKQLGEIQQCTDRCQAPILSAQQAIYGELQTFQERLQRCLVRCQDRAQESLPSDRDPSEAQVKKAQDQLLGCMDACAKEYSGGVPKLRAGIEAALKKIPRA
ncbi:hypothetical protein Rsub_04483 [Raphidocelis subcapitata]|uniref:Protein FAM136A n=1 Tax=Raphidocelis subcapitata TaxID=307507 RepID=A0A2V0NWY6_9CHLO|nr:hypothetical protein Rsub_04483 [Raphidocelis subcapitata]|eukprot:GBF92136.1 hypothetical protein Rsub_04483 [Raphidocelis subcapitata]